MDFGEIEEGWVPLQEGIFKMIQLANEGTSKLPQELYLELYNQTYNLCTKQMGFADQIYKRYGMAVDEHLREHILPIIRNKQGTVLLEEMKQLYARHVVLVKWLGSVFAYVDRHYAVLLKLMGMRDMAWNSFRLLVVDPCIENVSNAMIDIIEDFRRRSGNKGKDKMQLVGDTVKLLLAVGKNEEYYKRHFEDELVRKSVPYYKEQKQKIKFESSKGGEANFQQKVEEFIARERGWIKEYLYISSEGRLMELCYKELLGKKFVPEVQQEIQITTTGKDSANAVEDDDGVEK